VHTLCGLPPGSWTYDQLVRKLCVLTISGFHYVKETEVSPKNLRSALRI